MITTNLPITPRKACPLTVPASLERTQAYKPASVSRTLDMSKSPESSTCTRPEYSTGVVSVDGGDGWLELCVLLVESETCKKRSLGD